MADINELRTFLTHFRLRDLQILLTYVGESKAYGRKQQLYERALALLEGNPPIHIRQKIKELFKKRFKYQEGPAAEMHPSLCDGSNSGCGSSADGAAKREACKVPTSSRCVATWPLPVHPDVRLKPLPFYDAYEKGELLKPSSLTLSTTLSKYQENTFTFYLTPLQTRLIINSMKMGSREDPYGTQVQLRCCLLETSCEQEDKFPTGICIKVNGKAATLPNIIPTNRPGVEAKRPGRPVNITSLCKILATVANKIQVSWNADPLCNYCLSVYLVEQLTTNTLLERLKKFGTRHADCTWALIREKMRQDPDSEISTTCLRVSLICPLGKVKMVLPIRSSQCYHVQCFDAATFLQMNEKKPTWLCPVCDKPADFKSLVIDGLLVEILRQCPNATEIQFGDDGQWKALCDNDEKCKNAQIDIVADGCAKTCAAATYWNIIDLTADSDEETDDDVPLSHYLLDNSEKSPGELTFVTSRDMLSPTQGLMTNVSNAPSPICVDSTTDDISIISLPSSPALVSGQTSVRPADSAQISPFTSSSCEPQVRVGVSPSSTPPVRRQESGHTTASSRPAAYFLPTYRSTHEPNCNGLPDIVKCCDAATQNPTVVSSSQMVAKLGASMQMPADSTITFPSSFEQEVPPFSNYHFPPTNFTLVDSVSSRRPPLLPTPVAASLLLTAAPFSAPPPFDPLPQLSALAPLSMVRGTLQPRLFTSTPPPMVHGALQPRLFTSAPPPMPGTLQAELFTSAPPHWMAAPPPRLLTSTFMRPPNMVWPVVGPVRGWSEGNNRGPKTSSPVNFFFDNCLHD